MRVMKPDWRSSASTPCGSPAAAAVAAGPPVATSEEEPSAAGVPVSLPLPLPRLPAASTAVPGVLGSPGTAAAESAAERGQAKCAHGSAQGTVRRLAGAPTCCWVLRREGAADARLARVLADRLHLSCTRVAWSTVRDADRQLAPAARWQSSAAAKRGRTQGGLGEPGRHLLAGAVVHHCLLQLERHRGGAVAHGALVTAPGFRQAWGSARERAASTHSEGGSRSIPAWVAAACVLPLAVRRRASAAWVLLRKACSIPQPNLSHPSVLHGSCYSPGTGSHGGHVERACSRCGRCAAAAAPSLPAGPPHIVPPQSLRFRAYLSHLCRAPTATNSGALGLFDLSCGWWRPRPPPQVAPCAPQTYLFLSRNAGSSSSRWAAAALSLSSTCSPAPWPVPWPAPTTCHR